MDMIQGYGGEYTLGHRVVERKRFIINILYFIMIAMLAAIIFKVILPAALPFIIGLVVTLMLRRLILNLNEVLKIPYKLSAILVISVFYIIIIMITSLTGVWTWYGVEQLIGSIPSIYKSYIEQPIIEIISHLEESLAGVSSDTEVINILDNLGNDIINSVRGKIPDISVSALGELTGIAKKVPSIFIKLVLTVISTFFIALDFDRIAKLFNKILSKSMKHRMIILKTKEYLTGTLWVVIKSYITIMAITFAELSLGLTLIGINNSVLIALLIAIFDIMPVLGTGGVMIPWAIISAITGNYQQAVLLGIIYIVITIIRNIIEPKIVGKELGLNPLVTLILMFIGLTIFGVIGLFGLPIGLSLVLYLNRSAVIDLPFLVELLDNSDEDNA